MIKTQNHSFGSMETYEAEDKSFSKHTLKEGNAEMQVNEGSVCSVIIYTIDEKIDFPEGVLGDYKVNELCEVTVGEGYTLLSQLFDKILLTMKEGEIAYVKTKVDVEGKKVNDTGGSLKLKFSLNTLNRAADLNDLEPDEKLERAQHHKDKGTELFQNGNIDFAMLRYERALSYISDLDAKLPKDLAERCRTLKTQCYLNLAAGHLKKEHYKATVTNCNEALKLDANNVKALYRRAQAFIAQTSYEDAHRDLLQARTLEPANKAVLSSFQTVQDLIKKEKAMYQKMFS